MMRRPGACVVFAGVREALPAAEIFPHAKANQAMAREATASHRSRPSIWKRGPDMSHFRSDGPPVNRPASPLASTSRPCMEAFCLNHLLYRQKNPAGSSHYQEPTPIKTRRRRINDESVGRRPAHSEPGGQNATGQQCRQQNPGERPAGEQPKMFQHALIHEQIRDRNKKIGRPAAGTAQWGWLGPLYSPSLNLVAGNAAELSDKPSTSRSLPSGPMARTH
jgi:hypothetical protein